MLKILAFILLYQITFARLFQTQFKFSHFGANAGWLYLDKMTFAPGKVTYRFTTEVNGIPFGQQGWVHVQAVPQQQWQNQKKRKCQDIYHKPFMIHRLSLQGAYDTTREQFQIDQQKTYYFVLKDCGRKMLADYDNKNLNVKVTLHLLNNDKQVGEQQNHWYIIPIIIFVGIWMVVFYNDKLKHSNQTTQYHKLLMFGGIATQMSSLFWKTIGFGIYVYSGSDYMFFHIIYLLMHSVSQSAVISLIVLIGFGWTINFMNGADFDLYVPIIGCLAFINATLTVLTRLNSSDHDRHHIFDNISGNIIFGFRFIILIIFVCAIIHTFKTSRTKVKNFIVYFGIIGGVYICATPIIVFFGNLFIAPKDRHQFVFIMVQGTKCATNILMSYMLNHQKSAYSQVNYKNKSFLPQESKYF